MYYKSAASFGPNTQLTALYKAHRLYRNLYIRRMKEDESEVDDYFLATMQLSISSYFSKNVFLLFLYRCCCNGSKCLYFVGRSEAYPLQYSKRSSNDCHSLFGRCIENQCPHILIDKENSLYCYWIG